MVERSEYKTRKRWESPGTVRMLTFTCYQWLPLFTNDAIKQAFVDRLRIVRNTHALRLHAWVIMPEHIHMLITPDVERATVSRVLHALKRPFAEGVIRRWSELRAPILNRITDASGTRRFWQPGGGYDRNPRVFEGIASMVGYIHRNPVRRGLVKEAEDWPWSSARWYCALDDGPVEIDISEVDRKSRDWLKRRREEGWV